MDARLTTTGVPAGRKPNAPASPRAAIVPFLVLLLVLILGDLPAAQAAGNATIGDVALSTTDVYNGSSATLSFDVAIDDSGDSATLTVPSGFDASAFDGRTLSDGSGNTLATIAVSNGVITVTALVDGLDATASGSVSYTEDIDPGTTVPTTWTVGDGTQTTIDVVGIDEPATGEVSWYQPSKWAASQGWDDEGQYAIDWYARTPTGGYSSVTVQDTSGAGLVPDCSALVQSAYVRSWDQTAAADAWVASLYSTDYTVTSCDEVSGGSFTITFTYDVPATDYSNSVYGKVFYIGFTYRTYAVEATVADGAQWENTITSTTDTGETATSEASTTFSASGTGKRRVYLEKLLAGDTQTYASTAFGIELICTSSGSTVVDQTVSVLPGDDSASVLVPLGASCYAVEPDSAGASVAVADGSGTAVSSASPLAVTATAAGPLSLAVTNTFALGSVSWTKTDAEGVALPGAGWTLTGPDGFSEVFAAGSVSSWSVADLPWGEYTLTESTAPAGYAVADPVSFTVGAQQQAYSFTITDTPNAVTTVLAWTGLNGSTALVCTFVGTLLMALGAVGIYLIRRVPVE